MHKKPCRVSPAGLFIARQAAQEQINKGCNKLAEAQAKADANQQMQEAKADKPDAVKALGGLFK